MMKKTIVIFLVSFSVQLYAQRFDTVIYGKTLLESNSEIARLTEHVVEMIEKEPSEYIPDGGRIFIHYIPWYLWDGECNKEIFLDGSFIEKLRYVPKAYKKRTLRKNQKMYANHFSGMFVSIIVCDSLNMPFITLGIDSSPPFVESDFRVTEAEHNRLTKKAELNLTYLFRIIRGSFDYMFGLTEDNDFFAFKNSGNGEIQVMTLNEFIESDWWDNI